MNKIRMDVPQIQKAAEAGLGDDGNWKKGNTYFTYIRSLFDPSLDILHSAGYLDMNLL